MYLIDYHLHTHCSPDSHAHLEDVAVAALSAGMDEICVTDHCDLLEIDGVTAAQFRWAPIEEQLARARSQFAGKLPIRMGLELGEAWEDPALSQKIISHPDLDFVIGSIHTMDSQHGGADFSLLQYDSEEYCYEVLDNYFHSMERLSQMDCFDALGHVIYPLRYMNLRDGNHVTLDRYFPLLERVFRTILNKGKVIEVNTNRGRTVDDWRETLSLYRDCGGALVTLGSDAHVPQHVALGIPQAAALCKQYGLNLAIYEKHQPKVVRL